MRPWSATMSDWLVDYYALATVVLVGASVLTGRLRQPVRRLSVARTAFVGLAILATLAALPGWPRACWRGWPGQTQADLAAVSSSNEQNSGTPSPAANGTPSDLREAIPTARSLSVGREDGNGARRALTQPTVGALTGIVAVEGTSEWLNFVVSAYVVGGALVLGWLGIGLWQTAAVRRQSRPAPKGSRDVLADIVGDSGTVPDLLISGWLAQPVAVGLLRPAVILPERFVRDEPRCRLEAALAHEFVHFRNRDLWWIALSGLLMPMLFAHPMYWWLRRVCRDDQELLADAAAAKGRGDYAEALLAWARQTPDRLRLSVAGSVALWERRSQLKRRILVLLDRDFQVEPTCPRGWGACVRVSILCSVLVLSGLTFRPVAVGADAAAPEVDLKAGWKQEQAFGSGVKFDVFDTGRIAEVDPAYHRRLRLGSGNGDAHHRAGPLFGNQEKPQHGAVVLARMRGINPDFTEELGRGLLPVRRLVGHTAEIGEVGFSPDGRTALSCSADGTIQLWETGTGRKIRTLTGHRGSVKSVVFSRDGRHALSSGNDASVRYWEVDTGKELRQFEGHFGIVYSAVLACDDGRVLSCGQDGTLRLWDVGTGRLVQILEVNTRPIRSVAVSYDNRRAFSGGDDGIGHVWDLETGAELHRLEGHAGQIWHVAISPDGQMGLTAGKDKTVLMWDLRTGKMVRQFRGHQDQVNNLVFSPDGSRFLSVSDDRTIRLWDVESGKELGHSTAHASHVGAVAISSGGKLALTGGDDARICLWQIPE